MYVLYYVSFDHILISLTNFIGTPSSVRIMYNIFLLTESLGAHGSLVVKALSYKPEGRGFEI
jgi:hypothetical protein